MGTLIERLADAVGCGSVSADRLFDVGWSSCSARQSIHSNLINRESLMASPAVGAEIFRDNAALVTSL